MSHKIVYSHGFGVEASSRGMFSDIAEQFSASSHIMFNYNEFDETENTMTLSPFSNQVVTLKKMVTGAKAEEANDSIDLIAHSQGCMIAAMAELKGLRNIICLAPPERLDSQKMIDWFGARPGAVVDRQGISKLPRRDGSTTLVPAKYWDDLDGVDVIDAYNKLVVAGKVSFIVANQDEILGQTGFESLDDSIDIIRIDGNHDFSGEYRQGLLEQVKQILLV